MLANSVRQWKHHSCGVFSNPEKKTAFEFQEEDGVLSADILKVDARFVSLIRWLGDNHIHVRLSGQNTSGGYAVYKIRETAFGGGTKLSAEDGFLQFMIERLLSSNAPEEEAENEDQEEAGDEMKLTSIQSITDFMTCAGRKYPAGQHPSLGQKKPGCGPLSRGFPGGAPPRSACSFYHDECAVEKQLL